MQHRHPMGTFAIMLVGAFVRGHLMGATADTAASTASSVRASMEAAGIEERVDHALQFLETVVGSDADLLSVPFREAARVIFAKDRVCTDAEIITGEMATTLVDALESDESLSALRHAPLAILEGLSNFAYPVVMHSTKAETLGARLQGCIQLVQTVQMAAMNGVVAKVKLTLEWIESEKANAPEPVATQLHAIQDALNVMLQAVDSGGMEAVDQKLKAGYINGLELARTAMVHAPREVVKGLTACAHYFIDAHDAVAELGDSIASMRELLHSNGTAAWGWLKNQKAEADAKAETETEAEEQSNRKDYQRLATIMSGYAAMVDSAYEVGLADVTTKVAQDYAASIKLFEEDKVNLKHATRKVVLWIATYAREMTTRSKASGLLFAQVLQSLEDLEVVQDTDEEDMQQPTTPGGGPPAEATIDEVNIAPVEAAAASTASTAATAAATGSSEANEEKVLGEKVVGGAKSVAESIASSIEEVALVETAATATVESKEDGTQRGEKESESNVLPGGSTEGVVKVAPGEEAAPALQPAAPAAVESKTEKIQDTKGEESVVEPTVSSEEKVVSVKVVDEAPTAPASQPAAPAAIESKTEKTQDTKGKESVVEPTVPSEEKVASVKAVDEAPTAPALQPAAPAAVESKTEKTQGTKGKESVVEPTVPSEEKVASVKAVDEAPSFADKMRSFWRGMFVHEEL
jgi:ribosomal protein L25 (general stress protein Ctc)